ncbi:unnamed protein product [Protopolystoma xenopodis]|uniref:Uncharacterized protein n=1 Tax=Protopolystoma xenopodis TaxID=117903 RepID=A0A448XRJ1_9PLAT|nr:unnamed protein product [Protopolystoma xenopodis]
MYGHAIARLSLRSRKLLPLSVGYNRLFPAKAGGKSAPIDKPICMQLLNSTLSEHTDWTRHTTSRQFNNTFSFRNRQTYENI